MALEGGGECGEEAGEPASVSTTLQLSRATAIMPQLQKLTPSSVEHRHYKCIKRAHLENIFNSSIFLLMLAKPIGVLLLTAENYQPIIAFYKLLHDFCNPQNYRSITMTFRIIDDISIKYHHKYYGLGMPSLTNSTFFFTILQWGGEGRGRGGQTPCSKICCNLLQTFWHRNYLKLKST